MIAALFLGSQSKRLLCQGWITPKASVSTAIRRNRINSSIRLFASIDTLNNGQQTEGPTNENTDSNNSTEISRLREERKAKKATAKNKRRKLIGKAKAMDHGTPGVVTYRLERDPNNPVQYRAASGLPDRAQPFTVLGIESSCDDTGAAIVRSDGVILGEALASQHEIHEEWGGVVPGLARDAHAKNIDGMVDLALKRAGLDSVAQVDAIGVTVGPGLEICLRVGANKARELAQEYHKPFVGIHHLEAHILMARLPLDGNAQQFTIPATDKTHESTRTMDFPFLALLVSGGHCQILKCLDIGKYSILGGTLDDSLGEAFDKVARMLGLPVGGGGGPAVEALARQGDSSLVPLPIPLQKRKDCDFSFAGLKTAVRRAAEKMCDTELDGNVAELLTDEDKANIAASFQNIAICHIEQRLERAMKIVQEDDDKIKIRSLAVVGGVAANQELRLRLEILCGRLSQNQAEEDVWQMFVPPTRLCTDQGSMSAWAAIERLMVGSSDDPTKQEVYARYPFSLEHEQKDSTD